MATAEAPGKRQRGEIEKLPSGSLRVRVYAGIDPITRKKHYLTEVIPAGRGAAKAADKARTRLQAQGRLSASLRSAAATSGPVSQTITQERPKPSASRSS